jgi:hypothetical protein
MATIYAVIEEAEQLLATLWSGVEDVVRLARKLTRNLPSKFDGTCSALEGQLQSLGGKEWCAFLSRHQESTNSWAIPQSLRSQVQNCRNGSVLKQRLRTSDGYWLPFPVIVDLILKFPSAGINRHGEGDENALRRRSSDPPWPRVMRRRPQGRRRSVDRGTCRPGY